MILPRYRFALVGALLAVLGVTTGWTTPNRPSRPQKQPAQSFLDNVKPIQWVASGMVAASLAFSPLPSFAETAVADPPTKVQLDVETNTLIKSIEDNKGMLNEAVSSVVKETPSSDIKLDPPENKAAAVKDALNAGKEKDAAPTPPKQDATPPVVVASPAPVGEVKKVETKPAEEQKAAAPKVEEKKAEMPKVEEKKPEAPKAAEAQKVEEKKAEPPKAEEKKVVEAPKAEEKKVETPKAEEKKAEAPKAEEKKPEAPKIEEKKVEAPKAEEKKSETPKVEEKKEGEVKAPVAEAPKPAPEKAKEAQDLKEMLNDVVIKSKENAASSKKSSGEVPFLDRPLIRTKVPAVDGSGDVNLVLSNGQVAGGLIAAGGVSYLLSYSFYNSELSDDERLAKERKEAMAAKRARLPAATSARRPTGKAPTKPTRPPSGPKKQPAATSAGTYLDALSKPDPSTPWNGRATNGAANSNTRAPAKKRPRKKPAKTQSYVDSLEKNDAFADSLQNTRGPTNYLDSL